LIFEGFSASRRGDERDISFRALSSEMFCMSKGKLWAI
jgi:hypothetical protein